LLARTVLTHVTQQSRDRKGADAEIRSTTIIRKNDLAFNSPQNSLVLVAAMLLCGEAAQSMQKPPAL